MDIFLHYTIVLKLVLPLEGKRNLSIAGTCPTNNIINMTPVHNFELNYLKSFLWPTAQKNPTLTQI